MICPHCNTPNPPDAVYCIGCNALLPSPAEDKKQKRISVVLALLTAVLVPLFYVFVMASVTIVWSTRFSLSVPSGITESQFTDLYNEAFNKDSTYMSIISACIAVLIIGLFYAIRQRSLADAANIRSASPIKFGSALVCGLTLQIPIGIILSLIPFSDSIVNNHNELMTAATSPMWVQMLYGVVIAPVIEEIFFRGIAHDRLAKAMPVPLAAIISSAGFAIIHGELLSIIVAFVCGLVLAFLYSRFNTVLVPIGFHIGFNLLAYVAEYITDPLLTLAAAIASVALFIGSTYLLFKRDEADE